MFSKADFTSQKHLSSCSRNPITHNTDDVALYKKVWLGLIASFCGSPLPLLKGY